MSRSLLLLLLAVIAVSALSATPSAWAIQLVSAPSGAGGLAAGGTHPAVSADGRLVAFASDAPLVARDGNGVTDVYVRDLRTGAVELVSRSPDGSLRSVPSEAPAISGDGRYVAFRSDGTLFVRDRAAAATRAYPGTALDGSASQYPSEPRISADGSTIAYAAFAGGFPGDDGIFVVDRATGVVQRGDIETTGNPVSGVPSYDPSLSGDGRLLAFFSFGEIVADQADFPGAFVRDRQAGTAEQVGTGFARWPVLSADGRFVAYEEIAVGGDTSLLIRDRVTGTVEPVDVALDGTSAGVDAGRPAAVSANGRYVAFTSAADDLVVGDSDGVADVFVRDRLRGVTRRVSVSSDGNQADGPSGDPALSADGALVAFTSSATNLVPGDRDGAADVFAADRSAAQLLAELLAAVRGAQLGEHLERKVEQARAALAAGRPMAARALLAVFALGVRAQSGRTIPAAVASALLAQERDVVAAITG